MNQSNIPIIAIVGRPNVGKSTLFNRIIGKRTAIEAKEAGTTRDRLSSEFSWRSQNYILIDTAGLINPTNEILSESIKAAEIAIKQSDLVLFLVDFREGLTNDDLKIAKKLRVNEKSVILVANKSDNNFNDEYKDQFRRTGFENIVLISAISGKNTGDLLDLIYKLTLKSAKISTKNEREDNISVAIVGRPNVGKSTLLNELLNEKRMIVAESPNTTRDSQDCILKYKNRNLRIIDTAGISKKSKNERDTVESFAYLRSINAIRQSLVVVYLIDSSLITSLDLNILGQIIKLGKSIILAVNKCDLWRDNFEKQMLETISLFQDKLNFVPYIPIVFISAKKRVHLNNLLNQIIKIYTGRSLRPEQETIDQVFKQAISSQSGLYYLKSLKFEKSNPPIFKLKTDKNKKPHFSHLRYLENKIRDIYPYAGTPIFIDWIKE